MTFRMRAAASCSALLLLLAGCGGGQKPDPLAELSIEVDEVREYLLAVELDPDRDLAIEGVSLSADIGVESEYLGYVHQCRELCEIRPWGSDVEEAVERSVQGTTPLIVGEDESDVWVLFRVRVTGKGLDLMEDTGCLVVRDVRLELSEGREIAVRRPVQFLWVLVGPKDDRCAGTQIMAR